MGLGKDPLAAVLCAVELVGPCLFAGWAKNDDKSIGVRRGDPIAKSNSHAWVQLTAVSREQNKNTATIFPSLFTKACIDEHSIDIGKEITYAYHGARRLEVITSSSKTAEGNRPTFTLINESHWWLSNNGGHDMAKVIRRNVSKSKGGRARSLAITNAYNPSDDSIAQREREAWEREREGLAVDTGVLYDSLEAPEAVRLRPPHRQGDPPSTDAEIRAYLTAVLEVVRGDSTWLHIDSILAEILDTSNDMSDMLRFYFNVIVAAEDVWADPAAITAAIDPIVAAKRYAGGDPDRLGWDMVLPDEEIAVFFDGSKSDDSTGLVGCRLSDFYIFTLGIWAKPDGKRGENWLAPRGMVDARLREVMERFTVSGFWADPSHAQDDTDSTSYWRALIDEWHRDFKAILDPTGWARKSGHGVHSILFDMSSPENTRAFTLAAMEFNDALHRLDDIEEYDPAFKIDGHPALVAHMKHAKMAIYNKYGVSLRKRNRESKDKIDLAVCAVGARMLARILLNANVDDADDVPGEVWGALA